MWKPGNAWERSGVRVDSRMKGVDDRMSKRRQATEVWGEISWKWPRVGRLEL